MNRVDPLRSQILSDGRQLFCVYEKSGLGEIIFFHNSGNIGLFWEFEVYMEMSLQGHSRF